ncbi:guanitoxin biosynthesis heme-dependent pre-guanitoxin N-hydroxylase GntA [Bdellovibrio sp. HCB-162]|uniref:guanitoxin biosynthesis heme-dependent pre-guanitoxin N-hydroxylase GntA n=1 Tax=Bdellovibrio sp. HCB-162 TaxID=3394234 RepID=UPI0039BD8F1A
MSIKGVEEDIRNLISQKNYPCVAAVQSLFRKEMLWDVYEDFGTGKNSRTLASNLISFKRKQLQDHLSFLSYFAVFPNDISRDEAEFEQGLFKELSAIWDHPDIAGEWDSQFSDDPDDKKFCFSLDGSAFFVVGLHPQSSRKARRLPYNALVFNLYSQFNELRAKGQFDSMAALIRERDLKFQGSINPMVETYDNTWEAIQYSGKNNPPDWKCPFRKGTTKS